MNIAKQHHSLEFHDVAPEASNYIRLLKECARSKSLAEGKRIHQQIISSRQEKDLLVGSQLVRMYLECGSLDSARVAFDGMDKRDAAVWNAAIAEFGKKGHYTEALQLYLRMTEVGYVLPNDVTLVTVLKLLVLFPCEQSLKAARAIHASVVWRKKRNELDSCVAASLMNLYGKNGCLSDAESIFEEMSFKDRVSWSIMVRAYAENGEHRKARETFKRMQLEGIKPNQVVFVNMLNVLTRPEDLAEGKSLHSMVLHGGLETKVILATALVSMYGRCKCPEEAVGVFEKTCLKDIVVWNAMIGVYASNAEYKNSMTVFNNLVAGVSKKGRKWSVSPNRATFLTVLGGLSSAEALPDGKVVHAEIKHRGFETDVAVATALLNMYGKCGSLRQARRIFEQIKGRNVISWNAMISAYVQNKQDEQVLVLYHRMLLEGMVPSTVTFVAALEACASLTDIVEGTTVHSCAVESGCGPDHFLQTALVDMYAKCGSLKQAEVVFEAMENPDLVVWSALVAAHSQHGGGMGRLVTLKLFHKMQQGGIRPGHVAFLSVLSACRHAGLVEQGCLYFSSITSDHGLQVTPEQLGCMVDLLARAGWLSEAEALANRTPADALTWTTLLDACKTHGDVVRGRRVAEKLLKLKPRNSVAYVTLSQMLKVKGQRQKET